MDPSTISTFETVQSYTSQTLQRPEHPPLPNPSAIQSATTSLIEHIPAEGHGLEKTVSHLLTEITPGLNNSSLSRNYYGFITGGVTPAARLADNLVTLFDQNVMVHLPDQSIATVVENRALSMLLELLDFEPTEWARTFTTGATSSNVLGLACGREFVINEALKGSGSGEAGGVAELGLLKACAAAGIQDIQVLGTLSHSSVAKAASIVGLGNGSVVDVSKSDGSLAFDLQKLEERLRAPGVASIVALSCGEVNTGGFATYSVEEVEAIRSLCDKYHAWLHVDGGE